MARIIQGDCLIELAKMKARSVDLLLTDPPYGNDCSYYGGKRIAGDQHPLVACAAIAAAYPLLKLNRSALVFTSAAHVPFMDTFIRRYTDFTVKDVLVWDKARMGMGTSYRRGYELILALEKGRPAYRSKSLRNLLRVTNPINKVHPHEKPVELLQKLIEHTTEPGGLVLDPFVGSGSTAVAAERSGRSCIGIELDDAHSKYASERLASGVS